MEVCTMTQQPEQRFQAGRMHGSVWKNTSVVNGEEKEMISLSLQKRYKDKDGEWKNSNSLSLRDIPDAQLVLQKVYETCRLKEAEVDSSAE